MFVDSFIFLKGAIAGFFYSLAMLPAIVFIDKILLKRGMKNGIFAALGYVFINTLFAIVAAILLYFVTVSLNLNYKSLSLIGAMVLFIFAIRSYRKPLLPPTDDLPGNSNLKNFLSTIFLGVGNPIVILGYLAFFSS